MNHPPIEEFLRIMVKEGASDLILRSGSCPAIRMSGVIRFLGDDPMTQAALEQYLGAIVGERGMKEFRELGATDFALDVAGVGRFRGNAFRQTGELGFVFRRISTEIPSFKDLNLPVQPLKKLSSLTRGLVLATGTAGSGK